MYKAGHPGGVILKLEYYSTSVGNGVRISPRGGCEFAR